MDFFKSVLSDDPDPPGPEKAQGSEPNYPTTPSQKSQEYSENVNPDPTSPSHHIPDSNPNSSDVGGGGWSFGGLMKTFATRSESVIETYRRDLKEFGSGLKKETSLFREAASRAVKELPASIEVGALAAQGSLETVGHAIDGVLKSTAEIISHGKDTLLAPSDVDFDTFDNHNNSSQRLDSRRYSRFEAQLYAIQSDINTYCEEPEDFDGYNKWKLGFVLEEKSEEVEDLIEDNGSMEGIYKRVVPNEIDHDTFWCRYFYRVHKLKQQENVRANLVKRAISIDDDEELTWDVDDDDEESILALQDNALENKESGDNDLPQVVEEGSNDESQIGSSRAVDEDREKILNVASVEDGNVMKPSSNNVSNETTEVRNNESEPDVKVALDGKGDHSESCKDSDVSVESTQPSLQEEEDLGWDEIEDLGSNDEKKVSYGGSPNRTNVRKRLSAAEEDEDLNWDFEDDDEPVKA